MEEKTLQERVQGAESRATPGGLERAARELLREGEDAGGGINADRLVRFLLDDPSLPDEAVAWAYDRLKPAFRAAFEENSSWFYFEGD